MFANWFNSIYRITAVSLHDLLNKVVSVSRFSPLRGFPLMWELLSGKILTSVVINVSGRDVVYTGINELSYRF